MLLFFANICRTYRNHPLLDLAFYESLEVLGRPALWRNRVDAKFFHSLPHRWRFEGHDGGTMKLLNNLNRRSFG